MSRGRLVLASVTLALLSAAPGAALAQADVVPPVPDGYALTDVIADNGFETSTQRFAPFYPADGSAARSSTDPIAGASSLRVHVNAYGRVGARADVPVWRRAARRLGDGGREGACGRDLAGRAAAAGLLDRVLLQRRHATHDVSEPGAERAPGANRVPERAGAGPAA